MEMPKPGPAQKKIELFAGNWSGEEKLHPSQWDPQGSTAAGTLNSRVICDGFYVVSDYEQRCGGNVTFRGHSVLGVDPQSQEVVLHWFDSMGMGDNAFRGKWEGEEGGEGDRIALSFQSPAGHHRVSYDFSEKGTMRFRMEMSMDQKAWQTMMDGVYRKKA